MNFSIRFILIVVIAAFFAWLLVPFPQHKEYEETSWLSYYLYTDKDIRQAPKISQHYIYLYDAPDGGTREMSSIMFYDASDTGPLRLYLKTIGFSLESVTKDGTEETWLSHKKRNIVFSISMDRQKSIIRLTKTAI
jgi:hypothetical protein